MRFPDRTAEQWREILSQDTREGLIEWLVRIDPNGVWRDAECEEYLGAPMTREQAWIQVEMFLTEIALNDEARKSA